MMIKFAIQTASINCLIWNSNGNVVVVGKI